MTAQQWNGVLEAVKKQNGDQLKSQLRKLDEDIQKQKLVNLLLMKPIFPQKHEQTPLKKIYSLRFCDLDYFSRLLT